MAQYCASCITIMAQSCAQWLNPVHPQFIYVQLNTMHATTLLHVYINSTLLFVLYTPDEGPLAKTVVL